MHRLGHVPVACADHVADRPVQVRIDDRNRRPRHRAALLAPVGSVIEDPASLSSFGGAATWCAGPAAPSTSALTAGRWRPAGCPSAGCTGAGWSSTPPTHGGRLQPGPRRPGGHRRSPGTRRGRGRSTVGRDRRPPGSQPRAPRPARAGPGLARRPPPAAAGHRRNLAARHRSRPGRRWRVLDRRAAPGGRRARPGRRPGLAADRAAASHGGGDAARPVFRSWPTTDRWRGTVTLGNQPTPTARWERTGDQPDQSSRRLTSPPSR